MLTQNMLTLRVPDMIIYFFKNSKMYMKLYVHCYVHEIFYYIDFFFLILLAAQNTV